MKDTKEKAKEPQVKEVQVADFSRRPERAWYRCDICKQQAFREANGKEYHHSATCKKKNGMIPARTKS